MRVYSSVHVPTQQTGFQVDILQTLAMFLWMLICHLCAVLTGDVWCVLYIRQSYDAQGSASQRLEALQSLHVVRGETHSAVRLTTLERQRENIFKMKISS